MNKTIMTNDEWAVGFMEQLDTMLDGIENMNEKSRASFGNERFLTGRQIQSNMRLRISQSHIRQHFQRRIFLCLYYRQLAKGAAGGHYRR